MSKSIEEIAKIAATWWADKVAKPKFDNGDNSDNGGMAQLLAALGTKPVGIEAREKFISELKSKIEKRIYWEPKYERVPRMVLSVDYGPDKDLYEAAEAAGVNKMNFPWKTTMWIDKNHVSVSYGYRTPEEILYANKEHWEQRIKDAEDDLDKYNSGYYTYDWIEDEEERQKELIDSKARCENTLTQYKIEFDKAEE